MNLHCCVSVVFILFGTFATSEGNCPNGGCSETAIHSSYVLTPVSPCYDNNNTANATCGTATSTTPILCQNGTWSPNLNTSCGNCSISVSDANVIRVPGNATIDVGEVVQFTCGNGFNQSGPTNATCTAPGEWDLVGMPKCIAICETFEIENGKGPTAVAYASNTTTVSCDEGFTFGDDGNMTTITCQANGEWNNEPTCSAGNILSGALYLVTVSLAMGLVTSNM